MPCANQRLTPGDGGFRKGGFDASTIPCDTRDVTHNDHSLEQEQATYFALWRGIALVLVPGLIFVIGLIALVKPALPPVSTVYGCYRLGASPMIRVSPGQLSLDDPTIKPTKISIGPGKEGYLINAATGFSFQTDRAGKIHAVKDYPLGELIPVFMANSRPPQLGVILDGEDVRTPKLLACPVK